MLSYRHFNIQVRNRFTTTNRQVVRLIRHGVSHILSIILVPNRVPGRVGANKMEAKDFSRL